MVIVGIGGGLGGGVGVGGGVGIGRHHLYPTFISLILGYTTPHIPIMN